MDAAFIWNLSKLGRIGSRRLQFDDDFADRLNYQYTSVLLFLFIGLIGVRQYVGKPIQCWIPQEFTRGWEEYAENYCWVANTYFAPVENRLPPIPDRRESLLVYYQWAPIVMAAQALLFYLPCLLWRLGMAHSGFNLHRILQMAAEANEILPEATAKTVHILSYYMKSCIQRQRLYKYTNQYKDIELDNQFDNETIHEGEQFLHTCILDNNKDQTMNTNLVYTSNHVCPNELIKGENSFHIISKTFNDKTMSMVKLSNEQMVCNETIEPSMSSNSSSENLRKGRGRKPAPPPPPSKLKNTSIHSIHDHQKSQLEEQNIKSSENINNFQESRKISICKVVTENGELNQTIKNLHKKDQKLNLFTYFKCHLLWCGKQHGNYLVTLYMFVKFSYLSNVIGQIYLMQYFIGTKYTLYGAQVLIDLIKGQEWHHSGHFPRVTFCDLEAKKLGKNHVYTLQCVLPLNMFLEKIYIFLWFWHVLIAFINLISFILWIYRLFYQKSKIKFITNYLKILNLIPSNNNNTTHNNTHSNNQKEIKIKNKINQFIDYYLGLDSLFIIYLITSNCGLLLASELTADLWKNYEYLLNEKINNNQNHKTKKKFFLNKNQKNNQLFNKSINSINKINNNNNDNIIINHIYKESSIQPLDKSITSNNIINDSILYNCSPITTITPIPNNNNNNIIKSIQTHRSHIERLGNSSDDIV
ncbi:unnamed protein product [Schistosoma rodhaini]|uniref:Innexin n=1 Tax=Schistosoma mansoni TaxID=6183 RepID=A0A5K4F9Z5_SCHMA|nr:unnamed protein product [Schistosoma rodhaini]